MASRAKVVDRFLAIVLMGGGAFGAIMAVYGQDRIILDSNPALLEAHWIAFVLVALFLALFAWSAIVGFRFWRQDARMWKWATILFAAQIPIVALPGLRYEYYAGIFVALLGGLVPKSATLSFSIGSHAAMSFGSTINRLPYGVNLFACVAALYLFMRRAAYKSNAIRG